LPDIGDVNADDLLQEAVTSMDDSNNGYFPSAADFIAAGERGDQVATVRLRRRACFTVWRRLSARRQYEDCFIVD
jgi:hypothetical protein